MEGITDLHTYIMFYLVCIVAFVFGAMVLTVEEFYFRTPERPRGERLAAAKVVHCTWLELFWTLAPLGILVSIAVPSFALLYAMDEKEDVDLTVKAVGHQWYWEYQYAHIYWDNDIELLEDYYKPNFDVYMRADDDLSPGGLRLLEVDRAVCFPLSQRIRLLTTSADVIHSWALPAGGVKMDAIPGRLNQVQLYFNRIGLFYGQCSELCGVNHGFMPVAVKILNFADFERWHISPRWRE